MDTLLTELGFPQWTAATGRQSVADLYKPKQRCGIYVLRFANGERYVGQAVDVVRRFAQHTRTHSDITGVTFQVVSKTDLNRVERQFIHTCEAAGLPLRNLAHMSVVQGETDLDLVLTPDEQRAWAERETELFDTEQHVQDDDLRRRHRRKFEQFMTLPFAEDALKILGLYLNMSIPFPRRTELTFWMVSCLPYGMKENAVYLRVSLNMQETMTVYGSPEGPVVSFHLASSPFEAELGPGWREALVAEGWTVEDHRYAPAGHDQFNLFCLGWEDALTLMMDVTASNALSLLNLRLMRKGPTYYGTSHCLDLVDAAVQAIEADMNIVGQQGERSGDDGQRA